MSFSSTVALCSSNKLEAKSVRENQMYFFYVFVDLLVQGNKGIQQILILKHSVQYKLEGRQMIQHTVVHYELGILSQFCDVHQRLRFYPLVVPVHLHFILNYIRSVNLTKTRVS